MTEAEAVAELAQKQTMSELVDVGGAKVLVTRDGEATSAESVKGFLDEYRDKPERKKGTATLTNLDSFIAHVNREKLEHSAVFLNESGPRLVAVYDYQQPAAGEPRFHEHKAHYAFPLSDEWQAWMGKSGELISQREFAEFLEDQLTDVLDANTVKVRADIDALEHATGGHVATPQQLLEVSRGLKFKSNRSYANHEVLSSGDTQFTFEESTSAQTKAGQPLTVPTCFVISIPVFRLGAVYALAVKLRYRVCVDGSVAWGIALYKPEKRLEDALSEAAKRVESETGLPVFYGVPEGGG